MKSIEDTLKLINSIVNLLSKNDKVNIALIGGYGAIAHGVERTTVDVDFCIYTDIIHEKDTGVFTGLLKNTLPDNFEIKLIEGSKIMDDPFKHDVIFIYDKSGEYPKVDFIVAKYKWELEGLKSAEPLEDIPFPVLPKPYLIAMKLKAGGPKDDYDVIELHELLTDEEKEKTLKLAKLIHMDKKLAKLTKPRKIKKVRE
ncbi:MAG: hypothetical protein AB1480_07030 [Nitrospirota bacterium]